jgi:Flp pilus assembly pilin Flp
MVEYALMVSLIAVVCLAVVAALGTGVWNGFDQANTGIQSQGGAPRPPNTPPVPSSSACAESPGVWRGA